jgi:hypothetical protein
MRHTQLVACTLPYSAHDVDAPCRESSLSSQPRTCPCMLHMLYRVPIIQKMWAKRSPRRSAVLRAHARPHRGMGKGRSPSKGEMTQACQSWQRRQPDEAREPCKRAHAQHAARAHRMRLIRLRARVTRRVYGVFTLSGRALALAFPPSASPSAAVCSRRNASISAAWQKGPGLPMYQKCTAQGLAFKAGLELGSLVRDHINNHARVRGRVILGLPLPCSVL